MKIPTLRKLSAKTQTTSLSGDILAEIDSLIELLEAEIPANVESPENLKLVNKFEDDMAKYFKRLEQAMSMSGLTRIYNKYAED